LAVWLADKNAIPTQVTVPHFDSAHYVVSKEQKEGHKFL
jgi:hypothetical protein